MKFEKKANNKRKLKKKTKDICLDSIPSLKIHRPPVTGV